MKLPVQLLWSLIMCVNEFVDDSKSVLEHYSQLIFTSFSLSPLLVSLVLSLLSPMHII